MKTKVIGCLVLAAFIVCGCGTGSQLDAAFENAPTEAKQMLARAMKLDKANDYMDAAMAYDHLLQCGLTAAQCTAVRSAIYSLYGRLQTSAAKGNPDAVKLLETLKTNQNG